MMVQTLQPDLTEGTRIGLQQAVDVERDRAAYLGVIVHDI